MMTAMVDCMSVVETRLVQDRRTLNHDGQHYPGFYRYLMLLEDLAANMKTLTMRFDLDA